MTRLQKTFVKQLAALRQLPPVLRAASITRFHTRLQLTQPGFQRLFLMREKGADPLVEWKKWADRMTRLAGHRLPGNWKTQRGIKKRKRALMPYMR